MGYKYYPVSFRLEFAVLIHFFKLLIITFNTVPVYQNVNIVYKLYTVYFTFRVRAGLDKFLIKKKKKN